MYVPGEKKSWSSKRLAALSVSYQGGQHRLGVTIACQLFSYYRNSCYFKVCILGDFVNIASNITSKAGILSYQPINPATQFRGDVVLIGY